jgi:phosphoribosylaminoimidazole-succinocarboxamide synthase
MLASMQAVTTVDLKGVLHVRSGKVREIFDLGEKYLMVATDRVSAFDVVLPNGIPDKGKILNKLSGFWFERMSDIVPNHVITADDLEIESALGSSYDKAQLAGRCMIVSKCQPFPIECVARGYIAGSLYKEYAAAGGPGIGVEVNGNRFPPGLLNGSKLPDIYFTPATKAAAGHDENISLQQAAQIVGEQTAQKLKDLTIEIFSHASEMCDKAGILLADTKLEFGLRNDQIVLIDELLTPDSSRYWPKESYHAGAPHQSLDKQFVRDYLETLDWNKQPPGPELPEDVVLETRSRYIQIFKQITGRDPAL